MSDKKIEIKLKEYSYSCGDGCCLNYGTITTVNGNELDLHNSDTGAIVKQILEHLGYEVEINEDWDFED